MTTDIWLLNEIMKAQEQTGLAKKQQNDPLKGFAGRGSTAVEEALSKEARQRWTDANLPGHLLASELELIASYAEKCGTDLRTPGRDIFCSALPPCQTVPAFVVSLAVVNSKPSVRCSSHAVEVANQYGNLCTFIQLSPEQTGIYQCPICPENRAFIGYDKHGFPGDDCECGQEECICEVTLKQPFVVMESGEINYQAFEGGGANSDIGIYTSINCANCTRQIFPPWPVVDVNFVEEVREAFGECSAMFECHTVAEMTENFLETTASLPDEIKLHWWLDLNLSVEDGFGTASEMIAGMEARLNLLLLRHGLLPLQRRKYEKVNCAKCGGEVWYYEAFEDEGERSEIGRTFLYCSERCRAKH
jgi:hypothetical protein